MSDYDDDNMMYDSEIDDDYDDDMDYEDDDDDPSVRAENQYFEAKDIAIDDPEEGLNAFYIVLELEPTKGIWGFKSIKRMCKINHKLGRHDVVKELYTKLLNEYSSLLMENEKSINNLLDFISSSPNIKELYDMTLNQLEKNGNKKAMLRLELKLAKVLFDSRDFATLEKKLSIMHKDCQLPDGSDDPSKGNQLMDIYALEIQMYSERGNTRKLKELYQRALKIKGLCNPRVAGIIHECGGKMHMREKNWENANTDFFEAFKNYDDAGARNHACQCLKYLVLANMLSGSDINPFHEQRARSYQSNQDIEALIVLVEAYQKNDIKKFESQLKNHKEAIMGDPFIEKFINDLMTKIRSNVLLDRIKPYINVSLAFIAKELNISTEAVHDLLVQMILDGQVDGKIDQASLILKLNKTQESLKYRTLYSFVRDLKTLNSSIFNKVDV